MVALVWDDLDPSVGNGIWVYHDSANHRYIVEYDSVLHIRLPGTNEKCEMLLYDTTVASPTGDNVIVVQYQVVADFTSSTAGIQDPTRAIGIQDCYNNSYFDAAAPIQAGRAIKYCTFQPEVAVAERPAADARRLSLALSPNPSGRPSNIRFVLPSEARTSLRIYDATGRVIRTLADARLSAGIHDVVWNRRDDEGRRVSAGVYVVRLQTNQGTLSGKAVLLE